MLRLQSWLVAPCVDGKLEATEQELGTLTRALHMLKLQSYLHTSLGFDDTAGNFFTALSGFGIFGDMCNVYLLLSNCHLTCFMHTSAGSVPVRICPLNGYWSRVHSWDMNVPFMN